MIALRVFLLMVSLAPIRGEKDYAYRWELATAITESTPDEREQTILARLAWFEGGYRRAVARCEITGDHGSSRGTFQVQGQTPYDRSAACGSLWQQAELALRYVRRSVEVCAKNEGGAKLNLYVSGRCDRGHGKARERWGEP